MPKTAINIGGSDWTAKRTGNLLFSLSVAVTVGCAIASLLLELCLLAKQTKILSLNELGL